MLSVIYFENIDVLVLSARRPSLAAPPRGPQVCRTFIGTIPDHLHIFSRNLVLTFFRCHRSKYWLPTSAGPLCGLVAVPFVLLVVRSGPAPYFLAEERHTCGPRASGVAGHETPGARPQRRPPSQIGRVHDLIKIILISYCMIDNDIQFIVICFGLKS